MTSTPSSSDEPPPGGAPSVPGHDASERTSTRGYLVWGIAFVATGLGMQLALATAHLACSPTAGGAPRCTLEHRVMLDRLVARRIDVEGLTAAEARTEFERDGTAGDSRAETNHPVVLSTAAGEVRMNLLGERDAAEATAAAVRAGLEAGGPFAVEHRPTGIFAKLRILATGFVLWGLVSGAWAAVLRARPA